LESLDYPITLPLPKAVAASGLSRSAIYRAAACGRIRLLKLGRSTLVDMRSVSAFIDALPRLTPKK
jgi:predicted DNA-binding transcriptional regulator AlpA